MESRFYPAVQAHFLGMRDYLSLSLTWKKETNGEKQKMVAEELESVTGHTSLKQTNKQTNKRSQSYVDLIKLL